MSSIAKGVVALLIVFGLLFFLQSRVGEQPMTRSEQAVSADALR
jgi:hypothetical protein